MFFTRFPSTKLQDVNLDWILKKIRALRGGTTNQVLAKASDTDFDFKWVTGGGGTSDYNDLLNQPQINDVTLLGNLSASDLGLLDGAALAQYRTAADQDVIDSALDDDIAEIKAKIPAAASSVNQLMDAAAVNSAIASAVEGITGFSFEVVQALPATGEAGVIYLLPHTGGQTPNVYDEYIWIGTGFEQIGTTDIDLTGYATESWVQQQGYYSKPAAGIPITDLAPAVQASLGKADSALQSVPSTYRTAAAQDVIDGEITKTSAKSAELAIVIDENTTAIGAAIGQYVILRNSTISGKADGLYTAAKAIPANTAIDGTYLTGPIADGGLNQINSDNYYKPGDSITFARVGSVGRLVNAKNGVFVGFTLDKQIKASSASIRLAENNNCYATSKEMATAITNAGYSVSTLIKTTDSVTKFEMSGNTIWFIIPFKGTLNPASGTPGTIMVELSGAVITFT